MQFLLAQVVAPVVASEPNALGTVYGWVYGLVALGLIGVMGAAGAWFFSKWKETRALNLGRMLWENATAIVAHVEVHIRPTVKEALADGKLVAEERAKLKAEALRLLKEALREKGLGSLQSVLGLAGPAAEVYLSGLIERALGSQRAAGTLPPPGPAIVKGMNVAESFLKPR